jgi:uncharacterized protein YggE
MTRPVIFVTLAVVTLVATGATAFAQTPPSPPSADPPVIVTRGHASVKRAPDQAWVSIASETRAAMPADAQRLAAEAMTAVQSALAKAALPADAVRTTGYSLQPDMEYTGGRARVRGYVARNQIEVRVDNLDRLGNVIDAAGSSGATSMSGLRFDIKERAAVEREALRLAVQDAMGRAKAIAAGAGAGLGAIVRIEEHVDQVRPVPYMAMRSEAAAASPQTPITPGELEVEGTVTLTVGIK